MTHAPLPSAQPLIGLGTVRHRRLRPVPHAFEYPVQFLLLPLRTLRTHPVAALNRNRLGLIAFHDRDHGDGRPDCLAWAEELLAREGVHDADGEIWLHCFPRMLGHAFKPVSFWYCHRRDGSLSAVIAEVNNTFGERHCYLLDGPGIGFGRELQARKVFHVSPFCRTEGRYRFRFMRTDLLPGGAVRHPARTVVRVDHDDADGPLLQTSVGGVLQPLDARSARAAFWRMPAMGLAIVARIHWHALRLFLRRVPWTPKPTPPSGSVTR